MNSVECHFKRMNCSRQLKYFRCIFFCFYLDLKFHLLLLCPLSCTCRIPLFIAVSISPNALCCPSPVLPCHLHATISSILLPLSLLFFRHVSFLYFRLRYLLPFRYLLIAPPAPPTLTSLLSSLLPCAPLPEGPDLPSPIRPVCPRPRRARPERPYSNRSRAPNVTKYPTNAQPSTCRARRP